MTCYVGIIVYLVNIAAWKLIYRTRRVRATEMDLVTNRREFEQVEEDFRTQERQKPGFLERFGIQKLRCWTK